MTAPVPSKLALSGAASHTAETCCSLAAAVPRSRAHCQLRALSYLNVHDPPASCAPLPCAVSTFCGALGRCEGRELEAAALLARGAEADAAGEALEGARVRLRQGRRGSTCLEPLSQLAALHTGEESKDSCAGREGREREVGR